MATATNQFANKVVIVTGSVGNLGLATAHALQEAGAKTVLVARSDDRLRENYSDLIDSPDHFLAGGVDLTNPDSLVRMMQSTGERLGSLAALVSPLGAYS